MKGQRQPGGQTILIVEDERALSSALQKKLNAAGFVTFVAENGMRGYTEALALKPHLILLDILMPHMDGIAMLKELRKQPWGAQVPVIIMTNLRDRSARSDLKEYGIIDYLVKQDVTLAEVVTRVQKVFATR